MFVVCQLVVFSYGNKVLQYCLAHFCTEAFSQLENHLFAYTLAYVISVT